MAVPTIENLKRRIIVAMSATETLAWQQGPCECSCHTDWEHPSRGCCEELHSWDDGMSGLVYLHLGTLLWECEPGGCLNFSLDHTHGLVTTVTEAGLWEVAADLKGEMFQKFFAALPEPPRGGRNTLIWWHMTVTPAERQEALATALLEVTECK